MRKITREACQAFVEGNEFKKSSMEVFIDSLGHKALYLHGNQIAFQGSVELIISDCGWQTPTTKDILNGLFQIMNIDAILFQRDHQWYINVLCDTYEWKGGFAVRL